MIGQLRNNARFAWLALSFGATIYSDASVKTCGGKPGSRGREYQDALTYARWGRAQSFELLTNAIR